MKQLSIKLLDTNNNVINQIGMFVNGTETITEIEDKAWEKLFEEELKEEWLEVLEEKYGISNKEDHKAFREENGNYLVVELERKVW